MSTAEKHAAIVNLYQQGYTLVKIASELKCTYGSVLYVLYRKPGALWQ